MREFRTQDGNIIHLPDTQQQPDMLESPFDNDGYHCDCHRRMGNDFFFLPLGSCLKPSNVCSNPNGQHL